jgi:hypothetical protein
VPARIPGFHRLTAQRRAAELAGRQEGQTWTASARSADRQILCKPGRKPGAAPSPYRRNRAARRRCDDLLRALGELQLGMLAEGSDQDLVGRLASLAAALPQAADPALAAVARMISLRARIEVARRNGGI